jgi:hypothetical protein
MWILTVLGIINGTSVCTAANGTFTLTQSTIGTPSPCSRTSPTFNRGCARATSAHWNLRFDGAVWIVEVDDSTGTAVIGSISMPKEQFNCMGRNTFTINLGGHCGGTGILATAVPG